MGIIEDMFNPEYLFDNDQKQRNDIRTLTDAVANSSSRREVKELQAQVNQLQLLCNALAKMLEMKGVATEEELAVLVQQIDLLDGLADGQQSEQVWSEAPRCAHCNHFVNPQRDACVYCGRAIHTAGSGDGPYRGGAPSDPQVAARSATCAQCKKVVPQNQTSFTEDGELWCSTCF